MFGLFFLATAFSNQEMIARTAQEDVIHQDTTFDVAGAVAVIKEGIKGREKEPASEVFQNIKLMGNVPAGRLLAIMEYAYNGSLGVTCVHCHNPNDWSSDEKAEKNIAREMSTMVRTINQDLLGNIQNLKGQPAVVNCTTCHRGEITPKLDMRQ